MPMQNGWYEFWPLWNLVAGIVSQPICIVQAPQEASLCYETAHSMQVVDCGSVIAHIFDGQEARMQYDLETLWGGPNSNLGGGQVMQSVS